MPDIVILSVSLKITPRVLPFQPIPDLQYPFSPQTDEMSPSKREAYERHRATKRIRLPRYAEPSIQLSSKSPKCRGFPCSLYCGKSEVGSSRCNDNHQLSWFSLRDVHLGGIYELHLSRSNERTSHEPCYGLDRRSSAFGCTRINSNESEPEWNINSV